MNNKREWSGLKVLVLTLLILVVTGVGVYALYSVSERADVTITVEEVRFTGDTAVVETRGGDTFMTTDPGPADLELLKGLKEGEQYDCVAIERPAIRMIPLLGWPTLLSCEPAE